VLYAGVPGVRRTGVSVPSALLFAPHTTSGPLMRCDWAKSFIFWIFAASARISRPAMGACGVGFIIGVYWNTLLPRRNCTGSLTGAPVHVLSICTYVGAGI